jgi:hypothetical protein
VPPRGGRDSDTQLSAPAENLAVIVAVDVDSGLTVR